MRRVNLIPMAGQGQRFIDAGYKVPKQIIFVDALPRNTMSKVQKNVLRDTHKLTFT